MKLELAWWQCDGNLWCDLETVNLTNVTIDGVYLIWYSGDPLFPPRWVYVGQGNIKERLSNHSKEPKILQYKERGKLLTSWASVQPDYRDGVERYLAEVCSPLVGESWPSVTPIEVNLPR